MKKAFIKSSLHYKLRAYLIIDLDCVTDEQGIFLLFFLAVFSDEIRKTQADTQHHTCRHQKHKRYDVVPEVKPFNLNEKNKQTLCAPEQ